MLLQIRRLELIATVGTHNRTVVFLLVDAKSFLRDEKLEFGALVAEELGRVGMHTQTVTIRMVLAVEGCFADRCELALERLGARRLGMRGLGVRCHVEGSDDLKRGDAT
jgi:hypothetical protein